MVPQEIKIGSQYDPVMPPWGVQRKRDQCLEGITVLPWSLQRYLQQPRCANNLSGHQQMNGYRKHAHTHRILLSLKEGNPAFCNNADEPEDIMLSEIYCRERLILFDITYMWNQTKLNSCKRSGQEAARGRGKCDVGQRAQTSQGERHAFPGPDGPRGALAGNAGSCS